MNLHFFVLEREGAARMPKSNRHNRILNRLLAILLGPFLRLFFRFSYEKQRLQGPTLVICNHVTNYDPLLVSICFPKDHMHFVASEHLFRMGFVSRLLRYVFDPIPRKKGRNGADTAMACLRKLKQGRSVCLFAEGKCTWDGVTAPIVAGTGRMAKMSGATLLTYRLEGAYLTAPRWGKGLRPGKMTGRLVGVYTPEELKKMDGSQIDRCIQQDITEDTWARQARTPVAYRSRRRAENLQTVLYLCPVCRQVGGLRSKGKYLSCQCGKKWEFTPFGSFSPAEPFENIALWDAWQRQEICRQMDAGNLVLTEGEATAYEILADHRQQTLGSGMLTLESGALCCAGERIDLAEIDDMALVQSRNLFVTTGNRYIQFKAKKSCSLRKYRALWKHALDTKESKV